MTSSSSSFQMIIPGELMLMAYLSYCTVAYKLSIALRCGEDYALDYV